MKNIAIFFLVFFSFFSGLKVSNAQQIEEQNFGSRFYIGGNFGLQFGTVTLIDASPLLGYRVSKKLSIGAGVSYQYFRDARYTTPYTTNIYGGRAFVRYFLFKEIFAHMEYEMLNLEIYNYQANEYQRKNIHGILVGGGYRQWISQRMFMNILILWNLNETMEYPYNNPIFRVGIGVGL